MGPAARGIFLTLLMMQWREGSVPDDILKLLRVTKMPSDPIRTVLDVSEVDVEACLEQALECFSSDGEGGLYNETLREVKLEQTEKQSVISERARLGGLKSQHKRREQQAQLKSNLSSAQVEPKRTDLDLDLDLDKELNTTPKSTAKALSAFVIPEWVPKEAWNHYEEMRRRIRKPMTDQARKWAVKILDRFRAEGHDLVGVLEQSVFNSWQGLFAIRSNYDSNTQTAGRGNGVRGGGAEPTRPNTQAQRAFSNIAAVATVLRGSNRMAEEERGSGMADRRLTDGTGQKA